MQNIYRITPQNIQKAKTLINQGEIIAIPTETVYGLGTDATNEEAVRNLFVIKNRPFTNPMNILFANKENIGNYTIINNEIEQKIINKFMPGPITLILQKKDNIPDLLTAGNNTVGIRIPDNPQTIEILQGVKTPLVAPSANISGKKSPINIQEVYNYFGEKIPMIFDGGECQNRTSSTVCEVIDGKIKIWRKGPISLNDIILKCN